MQERKIPCATTKTQHSQIKKKTYEGNSLVVQWLRICLPVQGTQIQSLVCKDSTRCGQTKPLHHNYWARVPATEPMRPTAWTPQDKPPQWEAHTPHLESSLHFSQLEKVHLQQQRLKAAKNTFLKLHCLKKRERERENEEKNYKTLIKEIKDDLNKWRCSMLVDKKLNTVETSVLPRLINRFNAVQ